MKTEMNLEVVHAKRQLLYAIEENTLANEWEEHVVDLEQQIQILTSSNPPIFVLYKDDTNLELVNIAFAISKTEYLGMYKNDTVKRMLLDNLVVENPYAFYSGDAAALKQLINPEGYNAAQPTKPHRMRRTNINWEKKLRTWERRYNACEELQKIIVGREPKNVVYERFGLSDVIEPVKVPELHMRNDCPCKLENGILKPLKRVKMLRTKFYDKNGKLIKK